MELLKEKYKNIPLSEEVKNLPHWEERVNRICEEFEERFGLIPESISVWRWVNEKCWKLKALYETYDKELTLHEDYGRYF